VDTGQAQAGLDDNRQRPLRPGQQAGEVVFRVIVGPAASPQHLSIGQHDLQAGHVIGSDAVLEAVRSAGVLGDVAAMVAERPLDGSGG